MAAPAAVWTRMVAVAALLGHALGASNVHISHVRMPSVVLNDSLPSVVLDCEYELDAADRAAAGLVVKWYHNRSPAPSTSGSPATRRRRSACSEVTSTWVTWSAMTR
ncbi:uncharacterized protein LOC119093818 [Pollicipes pollicipes]|uniref:uncharacterized protein LOC119093818 n=1 Tax=Pollicipes pollicipes TaxID=41117 RepID=UPI00188507E8|nr:uncharacterized protein LOC119093818 [Pollicipes pollicipes]